MFRRECGPPKLDMSYVLPPRALRWWIYVAAPIVGTLIAIGILELCEWLEVLP